MAQPTGSAWSSPRPLPSLASHHPFLCSRGTRRLCLPPLACRALLFSLWSPAQGCLLQEACLICPTRKELAPPMVPLQRSVVIAQHPRYLFSCRLVTPTSCQTPLDPNLQQPPVPWQEHTDFLVCWAAPQGLRRADLLLARLRGLDRWPSSRLAHFWRPGAELRTSTWSVLSKHLSN